MKTSLLLTLLFIGSVSLAGGDWRPRTPPSAPPQSECTNNDGSRHPCAGGPAAPRAKSSPFACINGLVNPQKVLCSRTPNLTTPNDDVGTSTLDIEVTQWIQNPKSAEVCAIAGQNGYAASIQLFEVNRIAETGMTVGVVGKTREGNLVFKDYFVDHVQFTGTLARAVVADTGKNTASNGLDAGSYFTFQNGQLALTGNIHSFTLGITGEVRNLTFDCK
jgi:hypothetical protein